MGVDCSQLQVDCRAKPELPGTSWLEWSQVAAMLLRRQWIVFFYSWGEWYITGLAKGLMAHVNSSSTFCSSVVFGHHTLPHINQFVGFFCHPLCGFLICSWQTLPTGWWNVQQHYLGALISNAVARMVQFTLTFLTNSSIASPIIWRWQPASCQISLLHTIMVASKL